MEYSIRLQNCGYDKQLPESHRHGPIISNMFQMQFCTTGRGTFLADGKAYSLTKGDCIVNYPGQTRTEIADSNHPWGLMWLSLSGPSAHTFFEILGVSKDNPVLSFREHEYVLESLLELVRLFAAPDKSNSFMLGEKLFHFFNECLRIHAPDQLGSAQNPYIARAKHYLEIHYTDAELTVQHLANHIGLNRSYLYEIFKKETGLSPQEYLARIRLKKAKEILCLPGATVTSVAISVGYEPSVFSKAFKKATGITPSAYKTQKNDLQNTK